MKPPFGVELMHVEDAIRIRMSVRAYEDKNIEDALLLKILEAGRLAPSAMNLQPWHFVVVRDAEKRRALSAGRFAGFLKEAPVAIVGCADKKRSQKWCVIDTSIALQNMVLMATAEGLGTCWVGSFDEAKVKSLLKIPEDYTVVAIIAMGYEREKLDLASKLVRARNRRELERIVSFDEFGASIPLKGNKEND